MLPRAALAMCVVGFLSIGIAGCAASDGVEEESAEGALTGAVRAGTVVETTTALRIRRTPSTESSSNILGILPKGTKVKVVTGEPKDGFYEVEILDEELADAIKQPKGWCSGEHLLGGTPEEGVADVPAVTGEDTTAGDTDKTPTETETEPKPEVLKAGFISNSCMSLKDDNGAFMRPTINDYVGNAGGKVEFAALGINSDVLPFGTTLRIAEVDAEPGVKNAGRSILFKVVKTAPASNDPLKVTLCTTASGYLPPTGSQLTLTIVERAK